MPDDAPVISHVRGVIAAEDAVVTLSSCCFPWGVGTRRVGRLHTALTNSLLIMFSRAEHTVITERGPTGPRPAPSIAQPGEDMAQIASADGTRIGYDLLSDQGPTVVLVSGGLDDGTENIPLGQELATTFTVVNYRRRGRADSGDTAPYAVQREVEDLAAVVAAVGGRANLFGASSGGALALIAAGAGVPIDRIAIHEVPYLTDQNMIDSWAAYTSELATALDAGDRRQALRLFMRVAGSPEDVIDNAQSLPVWPGLLELAPTLRYDAACLGDGRPPNELLQNVTQPVLLTTGVTRDPHDGLSVDFFGRPRTRPRPCFPTAGT